MGKIAVTFDQAKRRFQRAHAAALKAEPLCRGLFDGWKAELLLAARGAYSPRRAYGQAAAAARLFGQRGLGPAPELN